MGREEVVHWKGLAHFAVGAATEDVIHTLQAPRVRHAYNEDIVYAMETLGTSRIFAATIKPVVANLYVAELAKVILTFFGL
jgi:hypothetical protein